MTNPADRIGNSKTDLKKASDHFAESKSARGPLVKFDSLTTRLTECENDRVNMTFSFKEAEEAKVPRGQMEPTTTLTPLSINLEIGKDH